MSENVGESTGGTVPCLGSACVPHRATWAFLGYTNLCKFLGSIPQGLKYPTVTN